MTAKELLSSVRGTWQIGTEFQALAYKHGISRRTLDDAARVSGVERYQMPGKLPEPRPGHLTMGVLEAYRSGKSVWWIPGPPKLPSSFAVSPSPPDPPEQPGRDHPENRVGPGYR